MFASVTPIIPIIFVGWWKVASHPHGIAQMRTVYRFPSGSGQIEIKHENQPFAQSVSKFHRFFSPVWIFPRIRVRRLFFPFSLLRHGCPKCPHPHSSPRSIPRPQSPHPSIPRPTILHPFRLQIPPGGPVDCSAGAPTDPDVQTLPHPVPQNIDISLLRSFIPASSA